MSMESDGEGDCRDGYLYFWESDREKEGIVTPVGRTAAHRRQAQGEANGVGGEMDHPQKSRSAVAFSPELARRPSFGGFARQGRFSFSNGLSWQL